MYAFLRCLLALLVVEWPLRSPLNRGLLTLLLPRSETDSKGADKTSWGKYGNSYIDETLDHYTKRPCKAGGEPAISNLYFMLE